MIRNYFHRWEQELAAVSQHERTVRPFEWGEEWLEARESGVGSRESEDVVSGSPLPAPGSRVSA